MKTLNDSWEDCKVLIWGKTYPELSSKYYETVCTGGTTHDGKFIRLYPIPFRYLHEDVTFTKYQWVNLRVKKAHEDPRPESYKVDINSITTGEKVPTDKYNWELRSKLIFKNNDFLFNSVNELINANKEKHTSLGFIKPREIIEINIDERPDSELNNFIKKLEANKKRSKQIELFGPITVPEVKQLTFVSKRFKVHWICSDKNCNGHKMSILDWEAYQLVRNIGIEKAHLRIKEILDLKKYDIGFFLGNFRLYPTTFAIGSIWYPKINNNLNLFK